MARAWIDPALKPYLGGSVVLHALSAAVFVSALHSAARAPKAQVYSIDFVGPSAAIAQAVARAQPPAPAAALAARPAPQAELDEFGRRRRKGFSLPKPSLLRGYRAPEEKNDGPAPNPTTAPSGTAAASPSGDAGIATDLPNFPYPWYISQVRAALWSQWQSRMPRAVNECVVVFSILPNGAVVDLRTEGSSGDSSFDLVALGAVQDASPFPPLPPGFQEPFLKVHVTLKSG